MGSLYQLTSPSGKTYIGISSKGTDARWRKHVEHALGKRENGALYSALRKYGHESFAVKTLVIADDWQYLCDLEKKAISAFNTLSPNGYNLTPGGEGAVGRVTTDRGRENISKAQKQRYADPEQRNKLREYGMAGAAARSAKCKSAPIKVKLSLPRTPRERVVTQEWKEIHSKRTKEGMSRPDVKQKVIESAKTRAANPEWRKKVSESKKGQGAGRTLPPEQKVKMSLARKAWWQKRKQDTETLSASLTGFQHSAP